MREPIFKARTKQGIAAVLGFLLGVLFAIWLDDTVGNGYLATPACEEKGFVK